MCEQRVRCSPGGRVRCKYCTDSLIDCTILLKYLCTFAAIVVHTFVQVLRKCTQFGAYFNDVEMDG